MLPALRAWTGDDLPALADLGYEGEAPILILPIKKPADRVLTDDQRQHNWLQAYARARAEQANALLKTTFKALRRVSLSPDIMGARAASSPELEAARELVRQAREQGLVADQARTGCSSR
jgi:hypothetical protein